MPFDFLRRRRRHAAADPAEAAGGGYPFEGLTEEWRLAGYLVIESPVREALNKREALKLRGMLWGAIDGTDPLGPASGLKTVDPYDLIVIAAGAGAADILDTNQKQALRVHRVPYQVRLDCNPFQIVGTVHLPPGSPPESLLDRHSELFLAVTDAGAYLNDHLLLGPDVLLVNRSYLRGVKQIESAGDEVLEAEAEGEQRPEEASPPSG